VNGDQRTANWRLPARKPLRVRSFLGTHQLPQVLQCPCRQLIRALDPFRDVHEFEMGITSRLAHKARPGKRLHTVRIAATQVLVDAEIHEVVEPLAPERGDALLGPRKRLVITAVMLEDSRELEKGMRAR